MPEELVMSRVRQCLNRLFLSSLLAAAAISAHAGGVGAANDQGHSRRWQLVHGIVLKWAPTVQETYGMDVRTWSRNMGTLFAKASLDSLQAAADARTFTAMNNALLAGGTPKQTLLGDVASDLVFIPVSPCRIFDTRVVGGPIAAGTTRDFDVTALSNYSFQGGDNSDCNGVGAAGSFAAAAINFTVVGSTGQGYITAYPLLTTKPFAATLAYPAAGLETTLGIVKLDQGPSAAEMTVYAHSTTHVVADIVGYFIAPKATALACVESTGSATLLPANGTVNATSPTCPAGYTMTSTSCESNSWYTPFVFMKSGTCSARNLSGSDASITASRTCCRVPGG